MNSWTGDVESTDDTEDDSTDDNEEKRIKDFPSTFEKAVRGSGEVTDISELDLVQHIEEVDDVDVLREGWLQTDGEKQSIIEKQIKAIGATVPGTTTDPQEAAETDKEYVGEDDEVDEDEDVEEESDSSSSSGWGSSPEPDDDSETPQPSIESVEDLDEEKDGEEDESAENESSAGSSESSGPPVPENAVSVEEAANRDRQWKIMAWGPPKLFKTHFAYTMPEPIAFIDTEGKADDIARKFTDKNIQFWQPKNMTAEPDTKFRRAKKALHEAMEWLDWYRENEGKTGTIVVDSMSIIWEWAQFHHKIENYPLKDPDEVELSANFGSSQESDWSVVKEYHNNEFRSVITDSPYHFYWTAMQRLDFQRKLNEDDNDRKFYEPRGETNNDHKVDTILRARKDSERGKVGDLVGSNFTDNVFVGMEKPTFPKVKQAVRSVEQAEGSENPKSRKQLADEIGSEVIIDYDPQMYVNEK